MSIELEPIGFVRVEAEDVPRSWRRSELEGALVIDERYLEGLVDVERGQRIVVILLSSKPRVLRGVAPADAAAHREEDGDL